MRGNIYRRLSKIEEKMLINFDEHSIKRRMSWARPLAEIISDKAEEVIYKALKKVGEIPPGVAFVSGLASEAHIQHNANRIAKTYTSREAAEIGEHQRGLERVKRDQPAIKALKEAIKNARRKGPNKQASHNE